MNEMDLCIIKGIFKTLINFQYDTAKHSNQQIMIFKKGSKKLENYIKKKSRYNIIVKTFVINMFNRRF